MVCKTCGKEFFEDWRKQKKKELPLFCCRNCSNTRNHSEETKEKIKKSVNCYFEKTIERRHCSICNAILKKNSKTDLCRNCLPKKEKVDKAEAVRNWKKRKKEKLIEYKGGKCEICGYAKCLAALEFHHKNPNEKEFSISSKNIRSFEAYLKEVDKCILLCSNCHREIHEKEKELKR